VQIVVAVSEFRSAIKALLSVRPLARGLRDVTTGQKTGNIVWILGEDAIEDGNGPSMVLWSKVVYKSGCEDDIECASRPW